MRSNEELMKEILKRKKAYQAKRKLRRLEIAGAGLGALLIAALILAPGISGSSNLAQGPISTLGATILGPEAGGYVIVALLAFALGIAVSQIILKRKQLKALDDTKEENTHE